MVGIMLRTAVTYFAVVLLMKISGKRQIGQLQNAELVTTFLMGELAADCIMDNSVPFLYTVVTAVSLICAEVILSFLAVKCAFLRRIFETKPLVLLRRGKIVYPAMREARLTMNELISAARLAGVNALCDVEYAVLEPNGGISVIAKVGKHPPCAEDMGISVKENGIAHTLIIDGKADKSMLRKVGYDDIWLEKTVSTLGYSSVKDVAYLGVDDDKDVSDVKKVDA